MKIYLVMETNTIYATTDKKEIANRYLEHMKKIINGDWYIIEKEIMKKLPNWIK